MTVRVYGAQSCVGGVIVLPHRLVESGTAHQINSTRKLEWSERSCYCSGQLNAHEQSVRTTDMHALTSIGAQRRGVSFS